MYRLLPSQKDLNNYRWLLQHRTKLVAGDADNDVTVTLRELLLQRYPDGNAPVAVDEPLPFTLTELGTALAAISTRVRRDGVDAQAAWEQLCNERSDSSCTDHVRPPRPGRPLTLSAEGGRSESESQDVQGEEERKQCHVSRLPSVPSSSNVPPPPEPRVVSHSLSSRPVRTRPGRRRPPPSSLSVSSPSLQLDRRALVREVMEEILPVLLQQQQAILRPAFDAVLSSSSAADADGDVGDNDDADTAMRYGCRNCETLQRQLEQSEADRVLLTAELDRLKEVPPNMSGSVSSSSGSGSSDSSLPSICAVPKGMTENEGKRHHSPRVDARKTLIRCLLNRK